MKGEILAAGEGGMGGGGGGASPPGPASAIVSIEISVNILHNRFSKIRATQVYLHPQLILQ